MSDLLGDAHTAKSGIAPLHLDNGRDEFRGRTFGTWRAEGLPMSNLSQRLSRLEPGPQHNEYLREVSLRLMRYGIETRNQVQAGKLPAQYWHPKEEEMYQQSKKDPEFDAFEREVLANPDA